MASAAKSIAYRVARRLCQFRILHVLSLDLAAPTLMPSSAEGLEYRWLTAEDIRAFAADPENDLDASMADSLRNGDRFCFGALRGSQLVNYAWYALDSIEAEHSFGAGITYPANTLYLYKAHTHPRYRGRQVHQSAVGRAARFFAARGIVRFIILVECVNWASLRSHRKLGFRQVGKILNVSRPPLQFQRFPRLVETLGLRFADQP
jgi:ribosomal protein S18 acetylase RimI-like enzyme